MGRRRRPGRAPCSPPAASPRSSGPGCPASSAARSPRPPTCRPDGSRSAGCSTPLRDPQTWLDALHAVVRFPFAIFSFVVTVTFWSGRPRRPHLRGLGLGAARRLDRPPTTRTCSSCVGLESTAGRRILCTPRSASSSPSSLPFVVRGVALLQASVGRALLTSRAATQAELGRLTEGRNAAVAAEAVALRRLERDIHDGPQQQLVRLNMDLARAQRQLERDPDAAPRPRSARRPAWPGRPWRTCARSPAASPRRSWPTAGLAAALAAIAARSAVPVDLDVDLPAERLAPVTENTAYFVVSEALANVAKHSDATACRVEVRCTGDRLRVVVEDDGSGGARAGPGARPVRARRPAARRRRRR